MAQNPLQIPSGPSGLAQRLDMNNAIQSLVTLFYGATDPATLSPSCAYPLMLWADSGTSKVWQRNAANSAWVQKGILIADGSIQWLPGVIVFTPTGNIVSSDVGSALIELDGRVGAGTGTKNKIINGDMVVDQRNGGAAQNAIPSGYTVDRWSYYGTALSKFNAQQNAGAITPPAGFTNYEGFTVASAYTPASSDFCFLSHKIEGLNCRDLAWGTANAQTVTLSFWVRSSLTGTHSGSLCNSAQNRSYPFTFTISQANTWTYIAITITGDTTGTWLKDTGIGIQLSFNLGCGSNALNTSGVWGGSQAFGATGSVNIVSTAGATFYITGVQLERGKTATPFESLQYGTQLVLCQRYFCLIDSNMAGYSPAGQNIFNSQSLPVTMRATPTIGAITTVYNYGVNAISYQATATTFQQDPASTGGGIVSSHITTTLSAEL